MYLHGTLSLVFVTVSLSFQKGHQYAAVFLLILIPLYIPHKQPSSYQL